MRLLTLLICLCFCTCGRAQGTQTDIPRPEHPKPQFERDDWKNLNGEWDFRIDYNNTGEQRDFVTDKTAYDRKITVPFPPESKLSGVEHLDFMDAVWYRRTFSVPEKWNGSRVFLHFGAVDYLAKIWVNGSHVGNHYGGSVSFALDVTDFLTEGANELVVKAEDDVRSRVQPSGKQSPNFGNTGCCKYTRTTGIWQTVWLEARPEAYLENARIIPDLDNERFTVQPVFRNLPDGYSFRTLVLAADGKEVLRQRDEATSHLVQSLPLKNARTWSPADPYLYDLRLQLLDANGKVADEVKSYAGMRKIHQVGNMIYLNNEPIFLRFVLDQGFYPDGVWTAPSDAALKQDIELSMSVGFNGARLHEKVFEERFHYWADKLGYLTWAEFPDWGMDRSYVNPVGLLNVQREWREEMLRDWNHPSIIAWTPLNETHSPKKGLEPYSRAVREIYDLTRALDPTRPINTTSGFLHVKTDIWTVHDYVQDGSKFAANYAQLPDSAYYINWDWYNKGERLAGYDREYDGTLPYVMDEYGGTFWLPEYASSDIRGGGRAKWGYGKTAEQVEDKIAELTKVLTDHPLIAGFTYTQLTDVHQEVNGIFTFDRKPKFDPKRLRVIFGAPAVYEGKR